MSTVLIILGIIALAILLAFCVTLGDGQAGALAGLV